MANQLAKGWEDQGNNLYKNSANGQTVDYNHPIYQDALRADTAPPVGDPPRQTDAPGFTSPIGDPQRQPGGGPLAPGAGGQVAVPPGAPAAPAPGAPAAAAPQMPIPPSPKPGPDWVATQDGQGWVPPNHPMAWKAPVTTAAPQPGVTGDPMRPNNGQPLPAPTATNVNDAFRTQLLDLMSKDPAQVSASDPAIKSQTDAYSAQRQLAQRQEREAAAEHFAAQGLDQSGAMDSEISREFGDMGRDVGQFSAGLVGQEQNRRTDMLKSVLALAGDQLSNEEKLALEKQIAAADDSTKRYGIDASTRLGSGDLDLRKFLGNGQLSLGLLQALQGGDQFNKRLGFDIGNAEAGYNRDALLSLMK